MKTFAAILHMFGNLLTLKQNYEQSNQILKTVLVGTRLLSCMIEFLRKNTKLDSDVVDYMCWVTYASSKARDLPTETLNVL